MLHNNFCVQKYVRNYLFCENIFEISRILVLRNKAKRNFAFFLISRNSRNSAKQFLFRIIFVFRENKKIDEIDNPRWTIIALRNLIFYFWSNIELTWHECSFMSQITNYKEKMLKKIFWDLI